MISAKLDTRKLDKDLKHLAKQVNLASEDAVIDLAKVISNQLAIRTKPYGNTNKARDIAQKAIYKDISKVYQNVGQTYNQIKKVSVSKAIMYAYCMNNSREKEAEQIALGVLGSFKVGHVDSGELLESNRTSNGRVPRNAKNPMGVSNESEIEVLKAKKVGLAGLAKAGWVQAGISLKSKFRVPAWLKKHSGLGSSKVVKDGWNTKVTLFNHVKYITEAISKTQINAAMSNAYKNKVKQLKKQLDAIAKKF